jgi:hypothetical protein
MAANGQSFCKICNEISVKIFRRKVLAQYEVDYYQCNSCGFIQTEEPYWLKEAYSKPLAIEDTGLVKRNMLYTQRTSTLLFFLYNRNGRFLDYGGGSGLFVRMMRDVGFDFFWTDPFTENLFARGFEYDEGSKQPIELITTYECFEHFINPIHEIEKILSISRSLLFSTEIFTKGTPDPDTWQYYHFSSGQHIALYSMNSLKHLAKRFNMNVYTNGKSFHLLTQKLLNNTMFNLLLKLSLLGMSPAVSLLMKTKTKDDSIIVEQRRGNLYREKE